MDQVARAPWISDAAVDLGAWELVDIDSWLGASEGIPPLEMITTRGLFLIATDRATEAARELNDVVAAEVPPPGQPLRPRHVILLSVGSFINAVAGDYKGALAYFTRADEQQRVVMPLHQQIIALSTMSVVANQLGRHEVAKQYLDRAALRLQVIEEFGATKFPIYTFSRALWHAARGDDSKALDLLEEAVDQGYRGFIQLRLHIPLDRYQDNARFKRLLARVDADIAAQRARAFESGWLIEPAVPTED